MKSKKERESQATRGQTENKTERDQRDKERKEGRKEMEEIMGMSCIKSE